MSKFLSFTLVAVICGVVAAPGTALAQAPPAPYDFRFVAETAETCVSSGKDTRLCTRPGEPVSECTAQGCVTYTANGPVKSTPTARKAIFVPIALGALRAGAAVGKHVAEKRVQAQVKREAAKRGA